MGEDQAEMPLLLSIIVPTRNEAGNVRRGLMPSFNTLNILAVPQRHNVSLVAPFAGGIRLSISGWLRYGEKPVTSG